MNAITMENLTKTYGKSRGIDHVTLEIKEGEFFGFIGPNGAGKSTTIRHLLGLIRPISGRCSVFGADCWTEKTKTLSIIGYLPSESSFYPDMKVKDVLQFSADLQHADCHNETIRLCEILQLNTEKKIRELSFGNKKKAAIVCAMQHRPKLLILDEPTSGLDPLMQKAFFELLEERHQEGATIFLSSHILSEVQKHCTRAAIIREGRIIACDKVENLTKTNIKHVIVEGTFDLPSLKEVRNVQSTDAGVSFFYGGDMTSLLNALSGGAVTDLTIREPELEDIFMHYYEVES